jgi:hypothetical protein
MGFSRSEIVDADDPARAIAVTTGIGVTLGDAPPGFTPIDLPPELPDTDNLPPLHVVFGATRDSDGWRLPRLDTRNASTSASLHIGPIHVAFEAAAMERASEVAGAEVQAEDWDVHFVAPGTIGPFLVLVDALMGQGPRVACRLTLIDEGNDRSVVAVGAASFRAGDATERGPGSMSHVATGTSAGPTLVLGTRPGRRCALLPVSDSPG